MFKNAFHYLYWENDTTTVSRFGSHFPGLSGGDPNRTTPYLLTQVKTRRTSELTKFGQRSKYIVRPEAADVLGNHIMWALMIGERDN